jgi:hypothetical protein
MRGGMYSLRVCSHDRGDFASIRGENVLIYWPHGLGDFVGLGYVLPFLHASNRYWITRFGDHSTSLMEGNPLVTPVYAGQPPAPKPPGHGASGDWHFGLRYSQADGTVRDVWLPPAILDVCRRERIGVLLWTAYPEVHGREPFPYHTKARHLIRHLAPVAPRDQPKLNRALRNSISFNVCPWAMRWVESRLRNDTDFGRRKLCIVSRTGYTSHGKNWGHKYRDDSGAAIEGQECRDFMRLMLRKSPRWMFLSMEDKLHFGDDTVRSKELNCFSFAEVFGSLQEATMPFAVVMKALLNLASLSVGVPTGPYHLSMAKPGLPTIGIWIEHMPSWYDEPKSASIHVIGKSIYNRMASLPGSFVSRGGLYYRTIASEFRTVSGELALMAVEQLVD